MEDAAVLEFEEIMRTFVVELVHAKGAVGAEAAGDEQLLRLEFIGKVVYHRPAAASAGS